MINFINTIIFLTTVYLTFELYVRGVSQLLVERYTVNADEVDTTVYIVQAICLTMICLSSLVELFRYVG
jgi:hypothetical protein